MSAAQMFAPKTAFLLDDDDVTDAGDENDTTPCYRTYISTSTRFRNILLIHKAPLISMQTLHAKYYLVVFIFTDLAWGCRALRK